MRTFYNQSEHEKYIELSPKRNEKKSLPVISHKEIPLHNYSFEKKYKKYKKTIDDQLQMKRWAYVSNPKKRDPLIIKYAKYFEGQRHHEVLRRWNPENESKNNSLALLESYFKRKQASKLKEIIKIPIQSTQQGVSSIGFEGINFQKQNNKRTTQNFYKTKRSSGSTLLTIDRNIDIEKSIPIKVQRNQKQIKNNKDLSTVDLYFIDNKSTVQKNIELI